MMDLRISVLHATLGRPKKALETMYYWQDAAYDPEGLEYLFAFNDDDGSRFEIMERDQSKDKFTVITMDLITRSSAAAWNAAASAASGLLLIQGQDDVYPPKNFDKSLLEIMHDNGGPDEPMVIAVGDGYRKGDAANLMCTAICTRAYVNMEGCFLWPGYASVYSDDEFSIRAFGHAADGEAKLVDARHLVFRHENPIHNKQIPVDATHQHENSPEAYSLGKRLFEERNKRLIARGFMKW